MVTDIMSARIVGIQGMMTTSSPDQVIDVHVRRMTRLLAIAVVGIVLIAAELTMILNAAIGMVISIVAHILERAGTLLRDLIRLLGVGHRLNGVKIARRGTSLTADGMATRKRDKWIDGMIIELHRDQRLSISIQDRYLLVTMALVMDTITHIPMATMARLLLVRVRQRSERKG